MNRNMIKNIIFILLVLVISAAYTTYGVIAAGVEQGVVKGARPEESKRLAAVKEQLKKGYTLNNIYTSIILAEQYGGDFKQLLTRYRQTSGWDVVETELKQKGAGIIKTKDSKGRELIQAPVMLYVKASRIEKKRTDMADHSELDKKYSKAKGLIENGYRAEDIQGAFEIAAIYLENEELAQDILDIRIAFGQNWKTILDNLGAGAESIASKTAGPIPAESIDASIDIALRELEWKYNVPQKKMDSLIKSGISTAEMEKQLFDEKVRFYDRREVSRQELEQAGYYAGMYGESLDRVVYLWKKYRDWYSVAWALYGQ